jgi:hypothetical protein
MKSKFKIGNLLVVMTDDKIEHDETKAVIHKVKEDEEYTFDAITCLARPVEFSILNRLYSLDKKEVRKVCDQVNQTKEIGVISTDNYHLILSPMFDRFTFFGSDEAENLTNEVIDKSIELNVKSLRITQFCLMQHEHPFFDQFKGIMSAFTTRKDSPIEVVYFDIHEKYFYELNIFFQTFEKGLVKH